jgi:hypothetical protein
MKKTLAKNFTAAVVAAFISGISSVAISQYTLPKPPVAEPAIAEFEFYGGDNYERAIAVSPNVNLTLCVVEGKLSINGWRRNEVRIYVHDGSKFGFKVLEKSSSDSKPVWISAYSQATKGVKAGASDCIRGEEVEIDLPVGATLNLSGKSIDTTIDSVKKVSVKTAGGDISVRNVSDGVTAFTYEGDITVEESKGALSLETTTGNIVVFEAGPSEIGDVFKAKTNSGAISLQRLLHRQIDVWSISGSVVFNGDILHGGSYSFGTNNGSIRLALPQNSSFQLSATYAFGNFVSELPFKILTENNQEGPVKSIVANIGIGGDAILKLTTNAGLIGIKKQ